VKRRWMLAILIMILSGCGGSAAPGGGQCNQGLCVKIEVVEPVQWGKPLTVRITVTTEADIPDLGISVYTFPPDVVVEGPVGWEPTSKDGMVWKGGAGWLVSTKANQPTVFIRNIRVPERESLVELWANASTREGRRVSHSVRIYLTREGGVVNPTPAVLPGTPALVPTMPPEWLLTPFPTVTPWPTPFPTPTYPPPARTPTPTQLPYPFISPISPISTPTPAAYP
jgi:hypothetical protein